MLKIVSVPNEVLTTPTCPVTDFDGSLKQTVKEMTETLEAQVDPQGVGLAATQVGIGSSFFLMKPNPDKPVTVICNPIILNRSDLNKVRPSKSSQTAKKKSKMQLEGCLSIARIWSPIQRPKKVLLEYQTIEGVKKKKWFRGFEAVIIQHEVDHLNGILFTQRALEQKSQLYEEIDGKLKKMEY